MPLVAAILAVWLGVAAPLATAHAAPGAVPAGATIAAAGTGTAPPPTDDGPVTTANHALVDLQFCNCSAIFGGSKGRRLRFGRVFLKGFPLRHQVPDLPHQ